MPSPCVLPSVRFVYGYTLILLVLCSVQKYIKSCIVSMFKKLVDSTDEIKEFKSKNLSSLPLLCDWMKNTCIILLSAWQRKSEWDWFVLFLTVYSVIFTRNFCNNISMLKSSTTNLFWFFLWIYWDSTADKRLITTSSMTRLQCFVASHGEGLFCLEY